MSLTTYNKICESFFVPKFLINEGYEHQTKNDFLNPFSLE